MQGYDQMLLLGGEEKQDQPLSVPAHLLLPLELIRMLMSHYTAASSLLLYAPYWVGRLLEWGLKEGVAWGISCLYSWKVGPQFPYQLMAGKRRANDLEASPSPH